MKTILDDPEGFFETGGWSFLEAESDASDKEVDDDISDEEDDAFEPSEDSEEESESDDDSEYDSDASDESGSGSGSGSGSDEEESGKDWSDLEEEARKADMEDSDDSPPRDSKKRPAPSKSNGKSQSAAKRPKK